MSYETGNTYVSENMRDAIQIPTASPSPAFLTMVSSIEVLPSDCDKTVNRKWRCDDGQNRKYIFGTMTCTTEIPKAFRKHVFRPRWARRNCLQSIARTIDNRKWQYRHFGLWSCHFRLSFLSKSLGCTFVDFIMVENDGFAVGISTLSVIVPEI